MWRNRANIIYRNVTGVKTAFDKSYDTHFLSRIAKKSVGTTRKEMFIMMLFRWAILRDGRINLRT